MLPFRLLELLQSLILDGKSRDEALKLTLGRRQSGVMSTFPPSKSIQVLGQRFLSRPCPTPCDPAYLQGHERR